MPVAEPLSALVRAEEHRLALLSMIMTVAAAGPEACAAVMDEATRWVLAAEGAVIEATGANEPVRRRFGAARVLTTICGACRACPRGLTGETPPLMVEAPPTPTSGR